MSLEDIGQGRGCGLFAGVDRRPIPLEGVRIDARLEGLASEVTVALEVSGRPEAGSLDRGIGSRAWRNARNETPISCGATAPSR